MLNIMREMKEVGALAFRGGHIVERFDRGERLVQKKEMTWSVCLSLRDDVSPGNFLQRRAL